VVGSERRLYQVTNVLYEGLRFEFSLTAHFISREWKRQKFVLCCKEFVGAHTGVNIGMTFRDMLQDWGLDGGRCHLVLRDEGSNMKKVISATVRKIKVEICRHSRTADMLTLIALLTS
jgi:hypothetical protein